jgi:flagellar motor switch protein FliN/FliY
MDTKNFFLKKIESYLYELDEIPLIRGEKFSWKNFSASIKKDLEIENVEISAKNLSWQEDKEILSNKKQTQTCFTISPLVGNAYFLMDSKDIKNLISSFLMQENITASLKEGFYRYLMLLCLKNLSNQKTFKNLSFKIVENVEMKAKTVLTLDIEIKINENTFFGKIAITPDLRKSWNTHFLSKESIAKEIFNENLELNPSITAGYSFLSKENINSLKPGDFFVLDRCYFDYKAQNGHVEISLLNTPIFQAKIKKNKIHILDYANYYEEKKIMEEKIEETTEEEEKIEEVSPVEEGAISIKDTPLKVTVELAKISMTLEKLTSLQPGNFLELSTSLEGPINLTVNGKKIGKGELISLGETLGVKILEIG